jgi:hypothetical protein
VRFGRARTKCLGHLVGLWVPGAGWTRMVERHGNHTHGSKYQRPKCQESLQNDSGQIQQQQNLTFCMFYTFIYKDSRKEGGVLSSH